VKRWSITAGWVSNSEKVTLRAGLVSITSALVQREGKLGRAGTPSNPSGEWPPPHFAFAPRPALSQT